MNKLALASLFCLSAANAVEYVEVDDERCHSDPSTPVIEPSPSPSPYPDPPTPVDDWDTTHAPTASPTNPCEGWVESLTLIDAKSFLDGDNNQAVMGYEILPTDKVVQLPQDSRRYTIRANVAEGVNKVRFYVNGTSVRADSSFPYSLAGENSDWTPGSKIVGDYKPYWDFKNKAPNYWIIQARGYKNNQAEPMSDSCEVRIRIEDGVNDEVQVEENDSCKPAQIVPSQGGDYEYQSLPIGIVERVTNETVSFKVKNTIMTGQGMGWITTNYVTQSKVEVCDKVENVAWNEEIDHVYEVKCYDGFAFVDIFAHTNVFDATKATADSSSLPEECRDSVGEKVVKYSFVMSCDCEANPTVPPEIVPGVDPIPPRCKGITADTWGDPHINTWDGSQHWNCQEEGEFIMSKATLPDYDYDFELRSRFTQFDQPNLEWSFNSGVAVKQDVLVQINFDTEVRPHSNMFADVPVSFYVDGVARKFTEGSGDHRVLVTRDGYDVQIFFVETGIHVYVLIRPLSVDDHITTLIPGSMSTYVCFPEFMEDKITDITGLWGTPGGGVANDYKTPAGDIVSFGGRDYPTDSQGNEYCRTNWCVSDESKSFFTLEANQQWSDFDYCENPRNRRHLVESDGRELNADDPKFAALTPELWELCGSVDNNTACLEDALAFAPSTWGAEVAVESLWLETHLSPEEEATIFDDDACCSTDFKTCMTTPGCDKGVMDGTLCAGCVEDGTPVTFLAEGEYPFGDEGSFAGCSALGSACSDGCCPGLACGSDDTCVVDEGVRRLTHAEWSRPDHADERQVVPLRHAEL